MRTSERVVYLVLLALLATAVFSQGRVDSTADADPVIADDLGPADALVLRGTKGDLRVRNEGGRIAWGSEPTDRAMSIAFVHVDKIMEQLMEAPRFADARTELEERERTKMKEFEAKREEFMQQYGRINPDHPDFERASEAWGVLREALEQWRTEMAEEMEKLMKEQIEGSWKDVLSAVDVISDRRGIDLVMRFVPTSEPFEAEDPTGGIMQVVERSVLRMPETLDLTPEVMKELNLRDE